MVDANLVSGRGLLVDSQGRPPLNSEVIDGILVVGQWQWSQRAQAWLGPAYEVSWNIGDNVGTAAGPWPGLGHATVQCSTLVGGAPDPSDQAITGVPQFDFDDAGTTARPATTTGSGVIFLIQTEAGFPHSPGAPVLDYDILDYLGDVTLTNATAVVPYAIDTGDGDDTDTVFYLDWPNRRFYQRSRGSWALLGSIADPTQQISVTSTSPGVPAVEGFGGPGSGGDPIGDADLFHFYADTGIGSYPNAGTRGRPDGTLILMGDLPADAVLNDGQMALWFDPTPGASFLRVKAKDSAGTVVTGTVPLA